MESFCIRVFVFVFFQLFVLGGRLTGVFGEIEKASGKETVKRF